MTDLLLSRFQELPDLPNLVLQHFFRLSECALEPGTFGPLFSELELYGRWHWAVPNTGSELDIPARYLSTSS